MNGPALRLLLVAACGLATAAVASAGIRYSHHDFSGAAWTENQMCVVCHTPHNANMTVANSPLWNHQVTTAVFTPYSSPTMDASPGQPGGVTKLCLSCHDGTVACDSFDTHSGTRRMTSDLYGRIGTDLTKHHPVSFTYDSALAAADRNLRDPATTDSGLGGTINDILLRNGRLECVSCHDVHVSRNTQGCIGCHDPNGGGFTYGTYIQNTLSLRKDNRGSALCLTCHIK